MSDLLQKGTRVRLLEPLLDGWIGEATVVQDQRCKGDLVRLVRDAGDPDADRFFARAHTLEVVPDDFRTHSVFS